jgi:membrane-bound serine protease (ClpP class)
MRRAVAAGLLLATLAGAALAPADEAPPPPGAFVARIVVDGTINPAVADYLKDALARAQREDAVALLVELDTPGGLLQSARVIVKEILGAPVPVIVWVAPSGAGAGSAGVFVTLAAHLAVMAPGTTIGAAHPVGGQGQDIGGDIGKKITNFTASFSETLAKQRGRNVEWAEKAVRESVSATADEAAKLHVVDFVARDLTELLQKGDGREVDVDGTRRKLALHAAIGHDGQPRVVDYDMRLGQRLLNVLADPNIAYLLLMAGLLGLYVEITHPGLGVPGVAGAICLVLGLTALHVLPVHWGALALLLVGAAMLVAEAFLPTFGVIGVGGLIAFLLGSVFLFGEGTGIAVARSVIAGAGGGLALFMLIVGTLVVRAHRRPAREGSEGMIGARGEVREALAPGGTVLVRGEYWKAIADEPLAAGDAVEVTAVDGLVLRVRRARPAGA